MIDDSVLPNSLDEELYTGLVDVDTSDQPEQPEYDGPDPGVNPDTHHEHEADTPIDDENELVALEESAGYSADSPGILAAFGGAVIAAPIGWNLIVLSRRKALPPEIISIASNQDNIAYLAELLTSNRAHLLPFVGAGLSKPFGYALWTEFLIGLGKRENVGPVVEVLIDQGKYEEAAQVFQDGIGQQAFNDAIMSEYHVRKLGGRAIKGAVSRMAKICSGPVITTNFDHVLESAFAKENTTFTDVVAGAKRYVTTEAIGLNQRFLLKLHGDVRELEDRILTKDEYDRYYGDPGGQPIDLSKPLPNLLRQIMISRSLFFVGCSLVTDRTIKVLESTVGEFPQHKHYAIVEMPASDGEFNNRKRWMADHSIRPIWYPNKKYQSVEIILAYLARI